MTFIARSPLIVVPETARGDGVSAALNEKIPLDDDEDVGDSLEVGEGSPFPGADCIKGSSFAPFQNRKFAELKFIGDGLDVVAGD